MNLHTNSSILQQAMHTTRCISTKSSSKHTLQGFVLDAIVLNCNMCTIHHNYMVDVIIRDVHASLFQLLHEGGLGNIKHYNY